MEGLLNRSFCVLLVCIVLLWDVVFYNSNCSSMSNIKNHPHKSVRKIIKFAFSLFLKYFNFVFWHHVMLQSGVKKSKILKQIA